MKKKIIFIATIIIFVTLSSFGMYQAYMKGYKIGHNIGKEKGIIIGNAKGYYSGVLHGYTRGNSDFNSDFKKTYYNHGFFNGYKVGKYNLELTSYQKSLVNGSFVNAESMKGFNNDQAINFTECSYPQCKRKTNSEYCGLHRCYYENCTMPIMYTSSLYCNEHKCIIPECNDCKADKTNYCKLHKK